MTELGEATEGKQEAAVSIEGKHQGMELLLEEPLVMATPVGLLAGHRITPKESLFVRNIQDPPRGHTLKAPSSGTRTATSERACSTPK